MLVNVLYCINMLIKIYNFYIQQTEYELRFTNDKFDNPVLLIFIREFLVPFSGKLFSKYSLSFTVTDWKFNFKNSVSISILVFCMRTNAHTFWSRYISMINAMYTWCIQFFYWAMHSNKAQCLTVPILQSLHSYSRAKRQNYFNFMPR